MHTMYRFEYKSIHSHICWLTSLPNICLLILSLAKTSYSERCSYFCWYENIIQSLGLAILFAAWSWDKYQTSDIRSPGFPLGGTGQPKTVFRAFLKSSQWKHYSSGELLLPKHNLLFSVSLAFQNIFFSPFDPKWNIHTPYLHSPGTFFWV